MSRVRAVWAVSLLILTIGTSVGPSPAASEAEGETNSFRMRVEVPELELFPRTDGFTELKLEGYRTSEGLPGSPDIPIRTILVAIPPDAEPRLEFRRLGNPARHVLRPRPVPSHHADPSVRLVEEAAGDRRLWARAERTPIRRYEADSKLFDGEGLYPAKAAWLGEVGVLRDQRYVEVHLAPVRYDARDRGVVRDPALEITIHFDGSSGLRTEPLPSRYESVYRHSFANHEQGRGFRMPEPTLDSAAMASATMGAATPRRRVVIREHGVVRLDYNLFLTEAPEFLAHDPANWQLTNRGVQLPLDIRQAPGDSAVLESGEFVQFYGQALDEEPKAVLNADNGGNEDLYEVRDFTDENVYMLSVAGEPQPAIATRAAAPGIGQPPMFFDATARVEVDDAYLPLGGADPWYWLPVLTEFDDERTDSVPLPGLVSATAPAQLRVHVRGISGCTGTDPDHVTRVAVWNDLGQRLRLPAGNPDNIGNANVGRFDGRSLFLHDFGWTHTGIQPVLTDPLDVVTAVDDVIGCANDVFLDWIEIDYRRSFEAAGDVLTFEYPDGDEEFEITGLASPESELHVYEVTGRIALTDVVDAVRLTGVQVTPTGATFSVRFGMDNDLSLPDGTPRRFVVTGAAGVLVPQAADFRFDRESRLRTDTTPADLIVVAHPELLESLCSEGGNPCSYDVDCTASETDRCELDPMSELSMLLAHRASQGISSRVARIQDVYDEFHDGLSGPLAIRNLVAWTIGGGWSGTPPSFLMLLGDASYDYKSETANGTYVPTQIMLKDNEILGFFASDNLLAAVTGDDSLPEMVVGRIPARTLAEADAVLEKVRLYEQAPGAGDGWRSNAVFLSDRANDFGEFEALEFERINAIGADLLANASGYSGQSFRYWSDNCAVSIHTCESGGNVCTDDGDCFGSDVCRPNCDRVAMRTDLQDSINSINGPGAVLAQFVGHGNFKLWSNDVLFCADAANPFCPDGDDTQSLQNGLELPWLLVHNCLSGGFHAIDPLSLGEAWLKHPSGGAIAVFAPSGLGFRFLGEAVVNEIWTDLFGPTKERSVAVPVLDSLVELCSTSGTPEGCQFYTLLGDPSMTLALPDVGPPTGYSASAGNAVVDLSWTASSTAGATYDVYRTHVLSLQFERVNESPIVGTTYADTDVENALAYFYYIVAVDPDGFESRWSNFNSDCVSAGPDCLIAQPLNPNPPQPPEGLVVVDAESGGRLNLTWNAGSEPDIDYYTVHYGPTPLLGDSFDVFDNAAFVGGLVDGTLVHVAVTATNTSGKSSNLSAQATGTPSLVLGLRAPGFVSDLRIGKSADDAELAWGAVTEDLYGKAIAIDHYEVFRSTAPEFEATPGNRIGTASSPTFADPGALAGGQPSYHYLVRAVADDGSTGGAGNQLPGGIGDLIVSPSLGDNLLLTWSAVATDFDGRPLAISHYEIYASDTPFGRAEIRDGLVPILVDDIPGSSKTLLPEPQNRYYSVLAVDARGNRSPF